MVRHAGELRIKGETKSQWDLGQGVCLSMCLCMGDQVWAPGDQVCSSGEIKE